MTLKPIAALGALLACSVPLLSQTPDARMTEKEMRTFYFASRSAYFAGQLPSNIEIKFVHNLMNDTIHKRVVAQTKCVREADGSLSGCTIELDYAYNNYQAGTEMTIYHEQCHIKLWKMNLKLEDQHVPEFQGCMLDLAERGAFESRW